MNSTIRVAENSLSQGSLEKLIEEAEQAEYRRDVDRLRAVLDPIWDDLEKDPAIPEADNATRAELLRLCGFFLGYYGHIKSAPDFQERGKDLLTRAIELFERVGSIEGAAKARLNLAWRYQQQGSHEEAAAILDYTKAQFARKKSHPIYLCIRVFESVAFVAKGEIDSAIRVIREIEKDVGRCDDDALRTQFHIEAGFAYTEKRDLNAASHHHRMAVKGAKLLKNDRFTAIAVGNLAYVLKEKGDFAAAHEEIEQAISLNMDAGLEGFLAHNYDTKAQILFDEAEYGRALLAIENALELFAKGEDFAGFADAKLNKARILFKLGETDQSLIVFSEVINLTRKKISETAAHRYAGEYQKLFYCPTGTDFHVEVAGFKKHLLRDALTRAGHVMKKAAATLNISQANLSDIVRRQFPELFDELGIRKRKKRRMGKKS